MNQLLRDQEIAVVLCDHLYLGSSRNFYIVICMLGIRSIWQRLPHIGLHSYRLAIIVRLRSATKLSAKLNSTTSLTFETPLASFKGILKSGVFIDPAYCLENLFVSSLVRKPILDRSTWVEDYSLLE